jgi:hypothetical protein
MEDTIYTISPIETPLFDSFSTAQRTIIRFSGYDEKVSINFRKMNKWRVPLIRPESTAIKKKGP